MPHRLFLSAAKNKVLSERMFDMGKYKHNKIVFLLHMLLIASFLAVTPITSAYAEWETLPYTEDYDEECDSMAEYVGEATESKWWEKPLDTVLSASVSVGNTVFDSVKGGAEKLMFVGIGLWLALFTMKVVGSMTESNPMENMTKIGGMMLKVGFASAFLHHKDWFFDTFLATVVQAGAAFVNTSAVGVGGDSPMENMGGGLDAVKTALMALAESIHDSIGEVIGKSNFLNCASTIHKWTLPILGEIGTFQDPKVWMSSCVINFGAKLFMIAFPFFLIDAAFRLGVVAALCPLFIISWVFPATKGFAGKGWNALLNIAFTFMMIKISALIAVKLLTSGSGLDEMTDSPDSLKRMVCVYRWANLGEDDVCEGLDIPDTNSMFMYIVCIVYGLMLMKNGGELAAFFSDAQFSNDTAFQAAKGAANITQRAVKDGVAAGGYLKDRVQTHQDRKAARIYEKDQRAREAAKNGGPAYNPSKSDQKQLDWAKKRLTSQRVGALNKDGTENGVAMSRLLENGKARTAMRIADKLLGGNGERFENLGATYSERSQGELQSLKSVGRNSHKSTAAQATANTAEQNMKQRQYENTSQGQNQKMYDQMMVDNLKKTADYKKRCASNPSFASSKEGQKIQNDLISEKKTLNNIKAEYGCDDKILDSNPNKKEPSAQAMASTAEQNMKQRQYENTPQGQNQKMYDQMMVDNLKKTADFKTKCAANPSFYKTEEGMKMEKDLNSEKKTLSNIKAEYGCDDKILETPKKEPSVNFENMSSFK